MAAPTPKPTAISIARLPLANTTITATIVPNPSLYLAQVDGTTITFRYPGITLSDGEAFSLIFDGIADATRTAVFEEVSAPSYAATQTTAYSTTLYLTTMTMFTNTSMPTVAGPRTHTNASTLVIGSPTVISTSSSETAPSITSTSGSQPSMASRTDSLTTVTGTSSDSATTSTSTESSSESTSASSTNSQGGAQAQQVRVGTKGLLAAMLGLLGLLGL